MLILLEAGVNTCELQGRVGIYSTSAQTYTRFPVSRNVYVPRSQVKDQNMIPMHSTVVTPFDTSMYTTKNETH